MIIKHAARCLGKEYKLLAFARRIAALEITSEHAHSSNYHWFPGNTCLELLQRLCNNKHLPLTFIRRTCYTQRIYIISIEPSHSPVKISTHKRWNVGWTMKFLYSLVNPLRMVFRVQWSSFYFSLVYLSWFDGWNEHQWASPTTHFARDGMYEAHDIEYFLTTPL